MWDGFVTDQGGTGACFLRALRFLLPILIPSIVHIHLIIRRCTDRILTLPLNGQLKKRERWEDNIKIDADGNPPGSWICYQGNGYSQ
jgi:hypothetical protein